MKFHKQYYHPSNSTFFTYGDLDVTQHLQFVNAQVIQPHFTRESNQTSEVLLDPKLEAPLHKEANFQPDQMQPPDQQAKLALSFLCPFDPAKDPY